MCICLYLIKENSERKPNMISMKNKDVKNTLHMTLLVELFKRKIVCAFEITQISSLYNFQWILQSKVLAKSIKEVRGM